MIYIGIALYSLVGLAIWRPLTGHLAHTFRRNSYGTKTRPSCDQWFGAGLVCLAASLFWPLVVMASLSGRVLPKIGAEREIENARLAKRVRELERELLR